jgi:hypothetical protein
MSMFFNIANVIYKVLILLVFLVPARSAFARFDHHDADRIDPEERSNTETYNDLNSYRYPALWEDIWQRSQFGYRNSAGSLNVSRFRYDEDIKIAPHPRAKYTASFVQTRHEDLVEQVIDREIRLGYGFLPNMRISIIGDGDTFKEFGDMGVALALYEGEDSLVELYYWNVDNYYKSKKSDVAAYRLKDSQTTGAHIKLGQSLLVPTFDIKLENDSPLDWHYPAAGFEYEYWRKFGSLNISWPLNTEQSIFVKTDQEEKMEQKVSLAVPGASKRMHRRASTAELGLNHHVSDNINYRASLQHVLRRVHYQNGAVTEELPMWRESKSPEKVYRQEWGLIATRYAQINDALAIQHGAYLNDVLIREDATEWKTFEIKYQLMFDVALNQNARLGINTTWDVDQVVRDYPYPKKSPFRPWGGGDLQFLMRI